MFRNKSIGTGSGSSTSQSRSVGGRPHSNPIISTYKDVASQSLPYDRAFILPPLIPLFVDLHPPPPSRINICFPVPKRVLMVLVLIPPMK